MTTSKTQATFQYVTDWTGAFKRTIAAIRQADGDDWSLSDSIHAEIKRNDDGTVPKAEWERLQAALTASGTSGKSVTTLRHYHAAAAFWSPADRVQGVSFTAHRRAKAIGDLAKAKVLIAKVLKAKGGNPAAVAERDIVAAVQAAKGVTPASATNTGGNVGPATSDPIAALLAAANGVTVDILNAASAARLESMSKVLTATLTRVTKAQARQAKAPAKVGGKRQAKAPAKTPAAAPATVGMRS